MSASAETVDNAAARAADVESARAKIRAIETSKGVTHTSLDAIDREVMVEPARDIALMPQDIRSIRTSAIRSTRHLHRDGPALIRRGARKDCGPETGAVVPDDRACQPRVHGADRQPLSGTRSDAPH